MNHVFIVNPAAGKGNAVKEISPNGMQALQERGDSFEIHRSLSKQEIYDYVHKVAEKGEPVRFYACGGDGTINDVLCGMIGFSNAELAVVPLGSGNDFVRNFTNKQNFLNPGAQFASRTMNIDVIRVGDTYSINMLNIGVDCDVVVAAKNASGRIIKGSMAYLVGVAQVLPKAKGYKMRYELDGKTYEEELFLAAVANGMYCGGGFKSSPRSSLTDGLIDVSIIRPVQGAKLLQMLLKYHQGTHLKDKEADKYIKYFQCKKFTLEPVGDINVSIDGEVSIFKRTEFEIMPGAVKLAVPQGCELIQ
jgi:YegS/Rv2252/BmrU family lipid kinase